MQTKLGLVAACLVLGACNGMSDQPDVSLEQSVPGVRSDMQALATPQMASRQTAVQAPSAPAAFLPSQAGSVASVQNHSYVNGFRQDILVKGSAVGGVDNGITVLARTSQQTTLDEAIPIFKPTETAIRSELGRAFPHVSMQVVERPMSNAYGSYGLALGRASDTIRCAYAWQWIEQSDLKDAGLLGPVTVRVRLCKADATFDALADLINHLTIRRDVATDRGADAGVEPPAAPKAYAPRKRSMSRRTRRTPRSVEQSDAARSAIAAVPAVSQPFATDLPPQAYLGPKATGTH